MNYGQRTALIVVVVVVVFVVIVTDNPIHVLRY
jgi:hypothetical protein